MPFRIRNTVHLIDIKCNLIDTKLVRPLFPKRCFNVFIVLTTGLEIWTLDEVLECFFERLAVDVFTCTGVNRKPNIVNKPF